MYHNHIIITVHKETNTELDFTWVNSFYLYLTDFLGLFQNYLQGMFLK